MTYNASTLIFHLIDTISHKLQQNNPIIPLPKTPTFQVSYLLATWDIQFSAFPTPKERNIRTSAIYSVRNACEKKEDNVHTHCDTAVAV